MNKFRFLFLLASSLLSCQNHIPYKANNEAVELSHMNDLADYYTYLDKVIELQKKYPLNQTETITIPIKFHVIRPLLNSSLIEDNFDKTIEYLNKYFKSTNIQFKQESGIDYLYSKASLDAFYSNDKIEKLLTQSTYNQRVLNLYVMNQVDNVLGYTHYPHMDNQRLFISEKHLQDPSIIHEMGHYFGLLHTFEGLQNANEIHHCRTNGDKICDTAPDMAGASFTMSDCTLFGNYFDQNGNSFNPDLLNFMSYYDLCRSSFSPEQQKRMYFIAKKIKLPQLTTKA